MLVDDAVSTRTRPCNGQSDDVAQPDPACCGEQSGRSEPRPAVDPAEAPDRRTRLLRRGGWWQAGARRHGRRRVQPVGPVGRRGRPRHPGTATATALPPIGDAAARPVVLVHGFAASASCWFALRRALRADGRVVATFDYWPWAPSVEDLGDRLVATIEDLLAVTGADKVDLVGHSLGGVVIAQALTDDRLAGCVDRVVTLGSPFGGTIWARLFPASPMVWELRPGSPSPPSPRRRTTSGGCDVAGLRLDVRPDRPAGPGRPGQPGCAAGDRRGGRTLGDVARPRRHRADRDGDQGPRRSPEPSHCVTPRIDVVFPPDERRPSSGTSGFVLAHGAWTELPTSNEESTSDRTELTEDNSCDS